MTRDEHSKWVEAADYDLPTALTYAEELLAKVENEQRFATILRLIQAILLLASALGLVWLVNLVLAWSGSSSVASLPILVGILGLAAAVAMIALLQAYIVKAANRRLRDSRVMIDISGVVREILPFRARHENWSDEKLRFLDSRVSRFPIGVDKFK